MQEDDGWAPGALRRGRRGKAVRQDRDNPRQVPVNEGVLLSLRSITFLRTTRGCMFHRGDAALQAVCGGCKSRLLHQSSLRACGERRRVPSSPWRRRIGCFDIVRMLFTTTGQANPQTTSNHGVSAGTRNGFIRRSPWVRFPSPQPFGVVME